MTEDHWTAAKAGTEVYVISDNGHFHRAVIIGTAKGKHGKTLICVRRFKIDPGQPVVTWEFNTNGLQDIVGKMKPYRLTVKNEDTDDHYAEQQRIHMKRLKNRKNFLGAK